MISMDITAELRAQVGVVLDILRNHARRVVFRYRRKDGRIRKVVLCSPSIRLSSANEPIITGVDTMCNLRQYAGEGNIRSFRLWNILEVF